MNTSTPTLDRLGALAEPTRARLLLVLERRELTVSELTVALQLPQSTVSRHLRILVDDGWLSSRSEGTSRYYRLSTELDPWAGRLWRVVREPVAGSDESRQDEARAQEAVARRRTRSQEFFSSAAGRWDAVRGELFGSRPELRALMALMDPAWVVGDLGCGTGGVAGSMAPFVGRVVAVDESPDMLAAARVRLEGVAGVELRPGRLESLPIEDGELDVALLVLVLHYVPEPDRALAEAARALRPGGRLLVLDMQAHGRSEYRETMGHLWQGFGRERMEVWLGDAGLERAAYHALPGEPGAKGPLLFTAVARKP
jgi:ubiquinone/menaquinone biosynthesis C-methylase UbiE/DNA-binding transcriptional ArsR family regulator